MFAEGLYKGLLRKSIVTHNSQLTVTFFRILHEMTVDLVGCLYLPFILFNFKYVNYTMCYAKYINCVHM